MKEHLPLIRLPTLEQLEAAILSQALSGEQGKNRAPKDMCQIEAENDLKAVYSWLNEYSHVTSTYRAYQKEAERLLLWCIYQQQKPLSSLRREDFEAYIEFLKHPQPQQLWCGKKGGEGISEES